MKIFITGSSGFLGKHLISILGKHKLLCLTRSSTQINKHKNVKFIKGDLIKPETYLPSLENFKPDCCIHLAWQDLPNYSFENNKINLLSGINLVESLKNVRCKKIFAVGSCWEYGDAQNSLDESLPLINLGDFAAFKSSLHLIMKSICQQNNINLIWGRVFFVYGPGQRISSLIPSSYFSLKKGEKLKVNNPLVLNDFIYVSDVVNAIRHLIELDNISGTYNIGSGEGRAVWEVVNHVASCLKLPPIYENMSKSLIGSWANLKNINKLGWKPKVSLEAGVFDTIKTFDFM